MTDAFKAWWATWWPAETQGGERMRSPEKLARDAWTAGRASMKAEAIEAILEASQTTADALGAVEAIEL